MGKEIIFESNRGIVFEKVVKNGWCNVSVKTKGKRYVHNKYEYYDVLGLTSPYVSWENLNCCGGWTYDETYLHSAVQNGSKLYAGITVTSSDDDPLSDQSANKLITELKHSLPDNCLMDYEIPSEHRNGPHLFRHLYICRKGAISDHINLDEVFDAYQRFGAVLNADDKSIISKWCDLQIYSFAGVNKPFGYANANSFTKLIVTGLLLGYPIESTISLL